MVIITDGTLSFNEEMQVFLYVSHDICHCPDCGMLLKHRDYKCRIMKTEGGNKHFIRIERLKCEQCHRLHNALPDILVPYKHYTTEIISGVLDETVSSDDLDDEDYPCEETMKCWHRWLIANQEYINGYMKSLGYRILGYRILGFSEDLLNSKVSLLSQLRNSSEVWLETILRIIYNSGGYLVPV